MLEHQPLDSTLRERIDFACGVPALNECLPQFADQHRRKGVSTVYAPADSGSPSTIVGYCTLIAAEADVRD